MKPSQFYALIPFTRCVYLWNLRAHPSHIILRLGAFRTRRIAGA